MVLILEFVFSKSVVYINFPNQVKEIRIIISTVGYFDIPKSPNSSWFNTSGNFSPPVRKPPEYSSDLNDIPFIEIGKMSKREVHSLDRFAMLENIALIFRDNVVTLITYSH
jgi:hypothetical protein